MKYIINNSKWFYLLSALMMATAACKQNGNSEKLPILGKREAVSKIVNGNELIDTLYQTIPAFSFLNQDSTEINQSDFSNSIYVTDFFFTTCPSICPIMSRNLLQVLDKYRGNEEVKILSHTINPKYDRPSVLKKYADKLGIEGNQWEFAWGPQADIYKMADSYMVFAKEDPNAPGGFEHQGWFILVDKQARIRGAYDGTDADQVSKLLSDMDILLAEYHEQ
ncbi:SCO family protein [Olivibacter sitiensis]|uniref:SCO family protein n=1 Tax=Olivibacter sitiensis TaxID=376470 RepID=UPI0004820AC7|nr:SCO family protein [Olivibacter sitiensis]